MKINHMDIPSPYAALFKTVNELIAGAKQRVASTANHELILLYWKVGKSIREVVLQKERAAYGKEVIANLSRQLTQQYGKGWSQQQLRHCLRSAEIFPEEQILSAVRRELSWTHLRTIMYIECVPWRNGAHVCSMSVLTACSTNARLFPRSLMN